MHPLPMTWDVDAVLRYIRELPSNHALTLQKLAHMLLALANADRCSDFAALDINLRYAQSNGVTLVITALTKTRRGGPPHEVFYSSFPEEPQLYALDTYIARTDSLHSRNQQGVRNPLFITVRKPYHPVKSAKIGRWIMKEAGVDTDIFTAHSTRGASMSRAKPVRISSADILKAANWSSGSTFHGFTTAQSSPPVLAVECSAFNEHHIIGEPCSKLTMLL